MAEIINNTTDEQVTLLVSHIFGRHRLTSHTVLTSADASRMHATVIWDGEDWLLQDSSTNGTFVNGNRVLPHTKHRIHKGDCIHFANLDGDTWQVQDDSAPNSLLVPISEGLETITLEDIAVLPSEENPEVTLYMSPKGHWICESEAGISVLKSGDIVGTRELTWRFIEARASEETQRVESKELPTSPQLGIYFDVSQNEEHVSLKFKMGEHEYDLGQRNHHYLLLLLARKRAEDKAAGLSELEQGWIDKESLGKMLGQSENHINIQIYRFRKQIVGVLPKSFSLPQPIERRTREIRFAYDDAEIYGGSKLTIKSSEQVGV